ncbi:MAG TPA: M56 family metallopeptidase [Candidatus Acidoferrales bacterium]|jgi:beta-lactamase regulating signal transducer with metallopeptidase domain|nr:M56 family metallopeptidase [Candidatus Acidoferrales bacterium]
MSPEVVHLSTRFLMVFAGAAARSLLLGCLVAASLAVFRIRTVRTKLLAWRGVLLAALAMPLLIASFPAVSFEVPVPSLQSPSVVAESALPQTAATHLVPFAAPATSAAAARVGDSPSPKHQAKAAPASALAARPRRQIEWPILAVGAYLAIVAGFLLRLAIGIFLGARLRDAAISIRDVAALREISAASHAAGLLAVPHLAESAALSVPLMMGVRDPVILVPPGWRQWDGEEFAGVLAHEVSHVARRDALMQRLALIHRAIFWFSPLAWWLERELAQLSEHASDEAALASGADRMRYAETLLGFFAELEAAPERVWWQGVSMAKAGQAEQRVERILTWSSAMSNKFTKAFAVGLAVCALPVVALTASLHPSFSAQQEQQMPVPAPLSPPAPPAQIAPPDEPASNAAPTPLPLPAAAALPAAPDPSREETPAVAMPETAPLPPLAQVEPPPPAAQAPAPPVPPVAGARGGSWNWGSNNYWPWGSRFVIVVPGSEPWMMSGSEEDKRHAQSLSGKIPGDFIWFERDEKSYIIRDSGTIDRAKKLWAPQQDVSRQQEELRKKEEALGKRMREQVQQKMADVRVKVPDLSAQLQKLQDEVKQLSSSGATMQQLGDLQREMGDLQRQLGETGWETRSQWADVGRQAGELGRQMGDLGRQIGELARQQVEKSRAAAEQMQHLLDDAIANGTAKPELK